MTEPCAVAHRALIQGGLKSGQSVAVFGAGPIGLMIAKWAHVLGAGQILLVDIDKRKVKFAQDAGFECVDGSACDAAAELVRLTGGKGPDTTIEGTGTGAAFAQALRAAAPFGTVVAMGNPVGDMNIPQKAYWEILRKQLNVCGTWNSRYGSRENDWREAVDAMSTGKIDLKPLISHRFPLSAGIKPFELMRGRTEFTNKILFTL
jgi:L-iditol 2-dehydrogenase